MIVVNFHRPGGGPQLYRPSLGRVSGDQHSRHQCAKTTGAGEISRDSARFGVKVKFTSTEKYHRSWMQLNDPIFSALVGYKMTGEVDLKPWLFNSYHAV